MTLLALLGVALGADEVVYGDELAPTWYDWSWSGIPDFASTDAYEGKYAAFIGIKPNGGFSIYRSSGLGEASALRFWMKGSGDVAVRFQAVGEGERSNDILLSPRLSSSWTQYTISIDDLPAHNWDRISWVDRTGLGGALHLDYVELLDDNPLLAFYDAAEPMPPNHVVVYGAGEPSEIRVLHDGKALTVTSLRTEGGPARTYVELEEDLGPGTLEVITADGVFTRELVGATLELDDKSTHQISLDIYGANFSGWPPSPAHMDRYGYTVVRWGGHELATYNPDTRTANQAEEGFFVNRVTHPSLEAWFREVDADLATIVTVPAFGWVADASSGWQFSVGKYGAQAEVSPDNDDAGNGLTPDGDRIFNTRNDAAVRFTSADAESWLDGIDPVPDFFAIGNELDNAHDTHRGLVQHVLDYDERLDRFLQYARAAKNAQPQVPVLGPVLSGWHSYWNTDDPEHKAAKKDQDFLPWFLAEVASADDAEGRRTLDYLDVHYFPAGLIENRWDSIQNASVDAWRLRATRSLWDPSFVDDSWIGTDDPVTNQADPHTVQLVPRLKGLLDEHYPGTKLAISEWSFGADTGVSGGLAAADALGAFGRYDVDLALITPPPPIGSFSGAAFELYRTGLLQFGRSSLPVTTDLDPDVGSIYAASLPDGRVTLVIVNKSPRDDLFLDVSGLPLTQIRTQHFGGAAQARVVGSPRSEAFRGHLLVPRYTAVLVEIEDDRPTDTGGTDGGVDSTDGDTGSTDRTDRVGGRACACSSPAGSPWWGLLLGAGLLLWRRQRS